MKKHQMKRRDFQIYRAQFLFRVFGVLRGSYLVVPSLPKEDAAAFPRRAFAGNKKQPEGWTTNQFFPACGRL